MSDVLAGMSRKEAEALVARIEPVEHAAIEDEDYGPTQAMTVICEDPDDVNKLMALAALGARCVGAKEAIIAAGGYLHVSGTVGATYCHQNRRVLVLEGE